MMSLISNTRAAKKMRRHPSRFAVMNNLDGHVAALPHAFLLTRKKDKKGSSASRKGHQLEVIIATGRTFDGKEETFGSTHSSGSPFHRNRSNKDNQPRPTTPKHERKSFLKAS